MAHARTLTRTQLQKLASELERERVRLEARLESETRQDGSLVDGASERISAEVRSGLGVTTESRSRTRYDAVVAAQARLDDGTYGSCLACGAEIPFGRLLVMPETSPLHGLRSTHLSGLPPRPRALRDACASAIGILPT